MSLEKQFKITMAIIDEMMEIVNLKKGQRPINLQGMWDRLNNIFYNLFHEFWNRQWRIVDKVQWRNYFFLKRIKTKIYVNYLTEIEKNKSFSPKIAQLYYFVIFWSKVNERVDKIY